LERTKKGNAKWGPKEKKKTKKKKEEEERIWSWDNCEVVLQNRN